MEQINKETKEVSNIFFNFVLKFVSKFSKIISSGSGTLSNLIFFYKNSKNSHIYLYNSIFHDNNKNNSNNNINNNKDINNKSIF